VATRFRDANLKIHRAYKHLIELEETVLSLQKKRTVTVQNNAETSHQELIHSIPNLQEALLNCSLISGDAIHNMRTALDFAWVQALGSRNIVVSDYSKFPIRTDRNSLEAALHGIQIDTRFPELFNSLMVDIQPCKGGNGEIIYDLHQLDIFDKHLLLLGLLPRAGIIGIVTRDKEGQIWKGSGISTESFGPFVIPFERDMRIEDEGELAFRVIIKEAGSLKNAPIQGLLLEFYESVKHIVQIMEGLCG
jgi:hypothetical protein